jgi:hypothetical protein
MALFYTKSEILTGIYIDEAGDKQMMCFSDLPLLHVKKLILRHKAIHCHDSECVSNGDT